MKLSSLTLITFATRISLGNIFALPLVTSKSPTLGKFLPFIKVLLRNLPLDVPFKIEKLLSDNVLTGIDEEGLQSTNDEQLVGSMRFSKYVYKELKI